MNVLLITIGLILGGIISGILIIHLFNKGKYISIGKFNDLNTQFKISEDRLATLRKENSNINDKYNSREDEINLTKQNNAEEKAKNNSLRERLDAEKENNRKSYEAIDLLRENISKLSLDNSILSANNNSLNEKLASQKQEITEIQKTAHLQFEKIANQIFEEKSGKFTETNKINIEALLRPLGENIASFKTKV